MSLRSKGGWTPHGELTSDERLVLDLIAKGYLYKQIAYMLELTYSSVKWKVYSMKKKLGLHTRAELVAYATEKGYV